MLITCTGCDTKMRVPDDAAGKIVKCPKCALRITVPASESPASAGAEAETGPVWASKGGDPRVTPIGGLLRRVRLDELPQLWNVHIGDMSFVGPRPERPEFVADLTRQIPFYGQRHIVRPGLTGWAQVCYTYGATTEDALQKLQYDLYYIKNLSIALDLYIVVETIKTVVLRRGA